MWRIGCNLQAILWSKGWTQRELEQATNRVVKGGISLPTLNKLCQGDAEGIKFHTAAVLCQVLGTDMNGLFPVIRD